MNDKADRAKQFAPFAALTGYYDMILQREKIYCERRERSDEENAELSQKMNMIKKGTIVKVTYYSQDGYLTKEGMVSQVDLAFRRLSVVKTRIFFDDIYKLEVVDMTK